MIETISNIQPRKQLGFHRLIYWKKNLSVNPRRKNGYATIAFVHAKGQLNPIRCHHIDIAIEPGSIKRYCNLIGIRLNTTFSIISV